MPHKYIYIYMRVGFINALINHSSVVTLISKHILPIKAAAAAK
jgi:hypothetical protein